MLRAPQINRSRDMRSMKDIARDNLLLAIRMAGGRKAVADMFEVTPQAVAGWIREGYMPVKRAKVLAAALGDDIVTASQLRPDLAEMFTEDLNE